MWCVRQCVRGLMWVFFTVRLESVVAKLWNRTALHYTTLHKEDNMKTLERGCFDERHSCQCKRMFVIFPAPPLCMFALSLLSLDISLCCPDLSRVGSC